MNARRIVISYILACIACGGVETKPSQTTTTSYDSSASSSRERGGNATDSNDTSVIGETTTTMTTPTRTIVARTAEQGSGNAERTITASIEREIMGETTLSMPSKNVQIVAVGWKVTLRGLVKNSQERATIEAIARRTTGVGEVNNRLEVKQ